MQYQYCTTKHRQTNIHLREKCKFHFSGKLTQSFTREQAPSPFQMHIFIYYTHADYFSDQLSRAYQTLADIKEAEAITCQ